MSSLADRFWTHVDKNGPTMPGMSTPCWVWTGSTNKGYGQLIVGSWRDGTRHLDQAHRVGWELVNGPIPDGAYVLHHCDNRACIRADRDPAISHTFLGDHVANMKDMWSKGRHSKNTKITQHAVEEIRSRYATGNVRQAVLASEFGLSKAETSRIIRGKRWGGPGCPPDVKARPTHCKRGHPFDEQNTAVRRNGLRMCRACAALAQRAYRRRRAA